MSFEEGHLLNVSIKSPLLQGALRTALLSDPFLFADSVSDTFVATAVRRL